MKKRTVKKLPLLCAMLWGCPSLYGEGELNWDFLSGGAISSPAIASDGSVLAGSSDLSLYSVDPATGTQNWQHQAGGVISAPAINGSGMAFVSVRIRITSQSHSVNVIAVGSTTGTKAWEVSLGQAISGGRFSSPAIAPDGTVIVLGGQEIYALDPGDGTIKWRYDSSIFVSPPTIGVDGTVFLSIYESGDNYKVIALSGTDGSKKWEFNTYGTLRYFAPISYFVVTPPVLTNRSLFIGTNNGSFCALDQATGTKRWEIVPEATNYTWSEATVGLNNTVYVAMVTQNESGRDSESIIYALDSQTGATKWQFEADQFNRAFTAAAADGTVYITTDSGMLYALDPSEMVDRYANGAVVSSSPKV